MIQSTKANRIPPLGQCAFFLDFDGTLVDIAPTPDSVTVPQDLPETLLRLRRKCADAVAIVTGRSIAQIDSFLPHIPYAVAGEHGFAIRFAPDTPAVKDASLALPEAWLQEAESIPQKYPGAMVEHKQAGLAVHFRANPALENSLKEHLEGWLRGNSAFHMHSAKMAWEIRSNKVNKGLAVERLMETLPFQGRCPIYVGDDVTDEDGIKKAVSLGGVGLRVPDDFSTPQDVLAWLVDLTERE